MNSTITRRGKASSTAWCRLCIILVILAVFNSSCGPAGEPPSTPAPVTRCTGSRTNNECVCIGNPTSGIEIDGELDVAWKDAFEFAFGSTTPAQASFGMMRNADYLYLYFQTNARQGFDPNEVLILTFDPKGNAADMRRFEISPIFDSGGPNTNGDPRSIYYWSNSSTWNNSAPPAPVDQESPGTLDDWVRVHVNRVPNTTNWRLEMSIKIIASSPDPSNDHGIDLPALGDFGFYLLDYNINDDGIAPYYWPTSTPPLSGSDMTDTTNTPPPAQWGNVLSSAVAGGAACNLVSITGSDLTTNQVPNDTISIINPNILYATAHNTAAGTSGAAPANDVTAEFKVANFGFPGPQQWIDVPAGNNPTTALSIPANGTTTFQTGSWSITDATAQALYRQNSHQCIQVRLRTTNPNTIFGQSMAQRNMTFVEAHSPYVGEITLGTEGYPQTPSGIQEFILSEFTYNTPTDAWKFTLQGMTDVGLQDLVSKGPHQYQLSVPSGKQFVIQTEVMPPAVTIPSEYVDVLPEVIGGTPQVIKVNAGDLITLVTEGSLELQGGGPLDEFLGPNGRFLGAIDQYLLNPRFSPQYAEGALIGSWDGFQKNSFIIGRALTVRVPQGASELFFSINNLPPNYVAAKDKGYHVQVIQTPYDEAFTRTSPRVKWAATFDDFQLPLGQNLPTWVLCARRVTGETITINDRLYPVTENVGCFGYIFNVIK